MGGKILNIGGGGGGKGIFPARLEITSMPKKTVYAVDETFKNDGLVIEVYYTNGVHAPSENYIVTPSGSLTDADDHITVSYTEAGKTVSIDISIRVFNVKRVLAENDWASIKFLIDEDQAENFWQVGDTKPITINGPVGNTTFDNFEIDAFILGFNHNDDLEGHHLIHFAIGKKDGELVGLVDSKYPSKSSDSGDFNMNTTDRNYGGWESSKMRTVLLGGDVEPAQAKDGTLAKALPEDLRAVMQPMTKWTDNTGSGNGNSERAVTETKDWIALLSEYEIHGSIRRSNQYEEAKQKRYAYFESGNPSVVHRHDDPETAVYAWCRSPDRTGVAGFCEVSKDGEAVSGSASNSFAVVSVFAV